MINLENSIQRYKKAGYTKQDTYNSIFNMSDKLMMIEDMRFNFTFDYAIPCDMWSNFKDDNFLYCLQNHISLYPNQNKYRLGFRVFPLVRLYKRFLTQRINKGFING